MVGDIMNQIKELRKSRGLSQKKLAQILNVHQTAISQWETGRTSPDIDLANKLASLFDVSIEQLLDLEECELHTDVFSTVPNIYPIDKKKIPLLGDIACGQPIYADEDRESYVIAGTDINADFCLRAHGDSMIGARILDGDIVFIKKADIVNNGEIAAVIIGDEATLKRVYYYPEKGKLVLTPENPKYEPLVYVGEELNEIHILGKAIAFQSDVI